MKRFDLVRFGSEKSCTFANKNARVVYIIRKNYEKSVHLFAYIKNYS